MKQLSSKDANKMFQDRNMEDRTKATTLEWGVLRSNCEVPSIEIRDWFDSELKAEGEILDHGQVSDLCSYVKLLSFSGMEQESALVYFGNF